MRSLITAGRARWARGDAARAAGRRMKRGRFVASWFWRCVLLEKKNCSQAWKAQLSMKFWVSFDFLEELSFDWLKRRYSNKNRNKFLFSSPKLLVTVNSQMTRSSFPGKVSWKSVVARRSSEKILKGQEALSGLQTWSVWSSSWCSLYPIRV